MMPKRSILVVLVLLAFALGGTHLVKARLDALRADAGFHELIYVPRGQALKIMTFGFDAPFADALWVQGQIYFTQNLRASQANTDSLARYKYVYQLFDLITDLNPRFSRAYVYGALFLSSTGEPDRIRQGIQLLDKGLAYFDQAAAEDELVGDDPRWQLCVHAATLYDQQLDDQARALEYYKRAAQSDEVPEMVLAALVGVEQQLMLGKGLVERVTAMVATYREMLAQVRARGAMDKTLEGAVESQLRELETLQEKMFVTRRIETDLTNAYQTFLAQEGRLPEHMGELIQRGILPGVPQFPFDRDNPFDDEPDWRMVLPDGRVRSYVLAKLEANFMVDVLVDAVRRHFKAFDRMFPGRLELLVSTGFLNQIPAHPLNAIGYRITFDPRNGEFGIFEPYVGRIVRPDASWNDLKEPAVLESEGGASIEPNAAGVVSP